MRRSERELYAHLPLTLYSFSRPTQLLLRSIAALHARHHNQAPPLCLCIVMDGHRRLAKNGQPINAGKPPPPPAALPKEKVASPMKGKWMSSTASRGLLDRLADFGYLPPSQTFFFPFLERLFIVAYTPLHQLFISFTWGSSSYTT